MAMLNAVMKVKVRYMMANNLVMFMKMEIGLRKFLSIWVLDRKIFEVTVRR